MPHFIRRAISFAAVITVTVPAQAQGPTSKDLSLTIIVTAKGDELFRSWDRPSGKPFTAEPVDAVRRGQFLSAVVLFQGCKPDAAGNCNVEMDITAYDPKGRTYGEMPKVELWQAKPAPAPGFTQLSRSFMGIVIEPTDASGKYRVSVVARDLNAKTQARSETTFTVRKCAVRSNPSLHPTRYSGLRPLPRAGELKR
jgi:hypothetical protein